MSVNNMSDFTARMPSDWTGVLGKLVDTPNDIIETQEKTVKAVTEASRVVGREGRLTQRAAFAMSRSCQWQGRRADATACPPSAVPRSCRATPAGASSLPLPGEISSARGRIPARRMQ